jgi:gamma-glutamylcyclotransferase (GGCT)/AIG2-like uncharacterized protein YtfP
MPGLNGYKLISSYVLRAEAASFNGRIFHLPMGYPVAIAGQGVVYGQALLVVDTPELWQKLDRYEGYRPGAARGNFYVRKKRLVNLLGTGDRVLAEMYLGAPGHNKWLVKRGIPIASGDWKRYIERVKL